MKANQGFRVAHMAARTNKDGTVLAIAGKRGTTTLTEFEADRLCRWLISLFQIDEQLEEAALGRMTRSMYRLADSLTAMVDTRIKEAEAARTAREKLVAAAAMRGLAAATKKHAPRKRTKHESQRRKRSR
jgi:hypothetical protein